MFMRRWLSVFIAMVIALGMFHTLGILTGIQAAEDGNEQVLEVEPICEVRPIATPVAGHFPSSLFKYPYKANKYNNNFTDAAAISVANGFDQTLTWEPKIEKAFLTNTEYTVTLTLEPNAGWSNCGMPAGDRSFSAHNITPAQIAGLPTKGVKGMTWEYAGAQNENLLIHITFNATDAMNAEPEYVFYEDFSKGVHDDKTIGEGYFMMAQQANRQGLGNWRDNMTSVRQREDGGSELVLSVKKDPTQAASDDPYVKNNWITAGGVRTRGRSQSQGGGAYGLDDIIYENAFGYYEANIKFPQNNVVWGAFWLFSPATAAPRTIAEGGSKYATEIDIIESCGFTTKFFNAAYHVYRNSADRSKDNGPRRDYERNLIYPSEEGWAEASRIGASEEVPIFSGFAESGVDIYDGEFHRIGLEWSPTDYIFYVDDVKIGSWSDLSSHYLDLNVPYSDWNTIKQNEGVMQNPAYIKLTVEAAAWADETWDDEWATNPENPWGDGRLGVYPNEGEMVVDYVYILNGPKPKPVVSVKPSASVYKLNGNKNDLTITVTEKLPDGSYNNITKVFRINNNAADTYTVGKYKVYVNTKGNNQIHACYIVD